jgi:hypothetical protein
MDGLCRDVADVCQAMLFPASFDASPTVIGVALGAAISIVSSTINPSIWRCKGVSGTAAAKRSTAPKITADRRCRAAVVIVLGGSCSNALMFFSITNSHFVACLLAMQELGHPSMSTVVAGLRPLKGD